MSKLMFNITRVSTAKTSLDKNKDYGLIKPTQSSLSVQYARDVKYRVSLRLKTKRYWLNKATEYFKYSGKHIFLMCLPEYSKEFSRYTKNTKEKEVIKMKTIAIVNQKGGVAKTTTTNALAIGLSRRGYKVLAIDLDPQGNLSMSFGVNFPDEHMSVADLILNNLREKENNVADYINNEFGVDFIIGNDDLGQVERILSGFRDGEYSLDNILRPLKSSYDYIIIDCMPSIGNLTENAIITADEIIIPSEPQFFSVKGIQSLCREIKKIKTKKNPNLQIIGILPTKLDIRTNIASEFIDKIKDVFDEEINIFSYIPISTKLAECNEAKNIFEYDKNGKGVLAYSKFIDDYLNTNSL
ncbi:MAG: ParA family protein [Oscillospiraceae bacterium]